MVAVVVDHGNFNGNIGGFIPTFHKDHSGDKIIAACVFVEHLNKLHDTTFAEEIFSVVGAVIIFLTEIIKRNIDAFIEVGQFTETAFQDIFLVKRSGEDGGIGPEVGMGTGFIA